jgi:hypothetical protein
MVMCEEIGSDHTQPLFIKETHWLSREKRELVFEIRIASLRTVGTASFVFE